MWAHQTAKVVTIDQLATWHRAHPGTRGITFSGGEPFEQAMALAALARLIHDAGGDVVCFSGHTLRALEREESLHVAALLAETDLLVAGPYLNEMVSHSTLVGSSNQQLHCLTSRIQSRDIEELPRTEWLGSTFATRISGFNLNRLEAALQAKGPENDQ